MFPVSFQFVGVSVLLVCQAAALGYIATRLSPTPDELPHLVAGLHYIETGNYELYCVNPPLLKVLAAWPAYMSGGRAPQFNEGSFRPEFEVGLAFWKQNPVEAIRYLLYARLVAIGFALFGSGMLLRLGNQLFSRRVAWIAAIFWTTSPMVLGYGALFSFDVASCALGLMATSVAIDWCKQPDWTNTTAVGVCLGLCVSTKSTWMLLFGLWPIVAVLAWHSKGAWRFTEVLLPPLSLTQTLSKIAWATVLGWAMLGSVYRFSGMFEPLGNYTFLSQRLNAVQRQFPTAVHYGNRFSESMLAKLPVPLPRAFVLGVDLQKLDFERSHPAYRHGRLHDRGIWYYYLLGLLFKVPVGVICAFLVGLIRIRNQSTALFSLLALPAGLLALLSLQTALNEHFRYTTILLGQILLVAAVGMDLLLERRQRILFGLCAVSAIVSPISCFPYCIGYTNEIAGGQYTTSERLGASTVVDWYHGWWEIEDWCKAPNAPDYVVIYPSKWFAPLLQKYETQPFGENPAAEERIPLLISPIDRQHEAPHWIGAARLGKPDEMIAGVELYWLSSEQIRSLGISSLRRVYIRPPE